MIKKQRRLLTILIVPSLVVSVFACVLSFSETNLGDNAPLKRLRSDLDIIFSDGRFTGANWSVQVYSLDHGEILYEKEATRLLVPASNIKIITAAVALLRLGPDYRFRTLLLKDGTVTDGTLNGNLIIAGFGDPAITADTPEEEPFQIFKSWAHTLKSKGIQKISGEILGDGSSFEHSMLGQGWAWDDLTEGYAAPISALQFNGNRMWLEIFSRNRNGAVPLVRLHPLPLYWIVENELTVQTKTDRIKIQIERSRSEESMVVRGVVPANRSVIRKEVAVLDPIHWYLSAFKHVLQMNSIDVRACNIRENNGTDIQSENLLHLHLSPPLSEIIKPLLKDSLNLYAETLIRVLGMELNGSGSFEHGREIVEETLGNMAIDTKRYAYADGSGLSRLNLVSAEVLVRILRSMYRHPHFSFFFDALSIASRDGTLKNRMIGTRAENNLRAKTGSLSRVAAISGYVKTSDGETLAFSVIANNYLTPKSEMVAAQDMALKKLAEFKRRQSTVGNRQ